MWPRLDHPRSVARQYNHSIITKDARLTLYPLAEDDNWGEFFDHRDDPGEHKNRYHDAKYGQEIEDLKSKLKADLPSNPSITARTLGFY